MNKRKILWSGLIMALVGSVVGLVLATLFDPPYTSRHYRHIRRIYIIVGGTGGFLYGASISTVKQLKNRQEHREQEIVTMHHSSNQDSSS